jgi:hypothetical protein
MLKKMYSYTPGTQYVEKQKPIDNESSRNTKAPVASTKNKRDNNQPAGMQAAFKKKA